MTQYSENLQAHMGRGEAPSESLYVVAIRAGSRLRFLPNEQLQVNVNIGSHRALLTFRTRYCEEGYKSPVPRELWIDARGPADSLDSAVVSFTNAALFFTTILSFCMNGNAGDCRFHLAYDATPGRKEREFFEQFVEDERGLPPISRRIRPSFITEFIKALATSLDMERLRRAIVQYGLALKYWSKGEEILAVAHLYMGIEALVALVRRIEQERLSLNSPQDLANHLGVPIEELDGTIRRDYLFCGDVECYRAAKRASDGVEHGFLEFDEVRPLATAVRNKTASYLRKAVIRLLNLPEEVANGLLEKPYGNPLGTEGYIRYLRGHLVADHDELAPAGFEYPIVEWKFGVKAFSIGEDGQMHLSFSESMTPRLGKDVSFHPKSVEVYGPEGVVATPRQRQEIEPEIVRHDTALGPKSQEELAALLHDTLGRDKVVEVRIKTESNEVFIISREKPSCKP